MRLINLLFAVTDRREPLYRESNKRTDNTAVVATFRNEAEHGKEFCDAENVTAHLRLKDSAGKEIGTGISRACWLDTTADMVVIRVAETQSVVLFVCEEEHKASIPYKRRVSSGINSEEIIDDFVDVDLSRLTAMEVELLDNNRVPLFPPVRINISLSEGIIHADLILSST